MTVSKLLLAILVVSHECEEVVMAMQTIEFKFPEDEGDEIEIEPSSATPMGEEVKEHPITAKKAPVEEDALEVDIIDDTPPADRGRTASDPPDEVTDDELQEYSEKVQRRIKHFSKGFHDERRAKETAERERQELEAYAKKLVEENKRLAGTVGKSQAAIFDQATRAVAGEIAAARAAYKEAYEAGNSDAVLEATERLSAARVREEQLKNIGTRALQKSAPEVKEEDTVPAGVRTNTPAPDARAVSWAKNNPWFGDPDKEEMTALALGYHTKLVRGKVDPTSNEYYEKLNARMREVFPEEFSGVEGETPKEEAKKRPTVVAPATRSANPKRVTLTKTQVAIAKKLGVPIELYARQVAKEMVEDNG